ncbi:hypothetical protein J2Z83_001674 [Virgibacillus natechei]|uniref:VCBS repeat-containing protein n=1 Tax=Virgibacillus natechei TaxID=1216297 RepID=A0ABS4IF81_9BACI|nr:hypothetical protein [Virgibacillus natechei]MBP1969570.1 hypothetical protein [Virgibacillus natechei]UZD11733.1 hypothetical protein OLD84_12325 [Virgibacillus natechei]
MKYLIHVIVCILVLIYPFENKTVVAQDNLDPVLIETYEADITGDGQNEAIELKGVLFSEDSSFFREIWIDISSAHDEHWKITYEGGYDPSISFIDLNHDGVQDIFYQSATGGSGGLYNYHLHTIKNEVEKEISLPEQLYIKGEFLDNFNVEIQLSPHIEPSIMDVKDRADEYIRLGIYNEEGDVQQPNSVMIDPIAFFEPVLLSKPKGYGLKSYQQISGAYHADQLGTVETLWYYENDEWIILQTDWIPSQ